MTMTLISTTTVGAGGASNIGFTNIPQGYTDLMLLVSAKTNVNGTVDGVRLTVNNIDLYPSGWGKRLFGSGSGTASDSSYNFIAITGSGTGMTNTFGNVSIYLPNASGNDLKLISSDSVTENNGTTAYQMLGAGLSSVSAPITSVSIGNFDSGGTAFVQYSTVSLYGIQKGGTTPTVA